MTDFPHQFIANAQSRRTLLLLHGTGGDENDLLPLGRAIDPGAALLSPRGRVSENGANRYFRRLAEGVFDEKDVVARAHELADWIAFAAENYGIDRGELVVTGYSNGANIASAMMLLGVAHFPAAILLRPVPPLAQASMTPLEGTRVLLLGGARDPLAPPPAVDALADLFRVRGAEVTRETQTTGHELSRSDVTTARDWLAAAAIA